jgi:GNAT superfamily N-acetyltransferase
MGGLTATVGAALCIERAGVEHAPVIAELNQHVHTLHVEAEPGQFRALTPEDARPTFATMLQDNDPVVFVATRDDRSVGYIWAEEVQRPDNPFTSPWRVLYVHHIAVAPEERRSGVGRALVAAVADEGRRRGVNSLGLDHWSFNETAARFFEALGFEPYNVRMRRDL